jgi:hypothetical protein
VREVLGNLESYTEELSTLMTETVQLFAATK